MSAPALAMPTAITPMPGHHRALDRYLRLGIDHLQLFDQLGQVFDGVQVVVVGRRKQRHVRRGAAGFGHLGGNLEAGQHAAFAGLGALADLDLDHGGRVEEFGVDPKAPGGHLLAAVLLVQRP